MAEDMAQLPANYGVVKGVLEYDQDKWYPVIRTNPARAWEWNHFTLTGDIREDISEARFQALSFDEKSEAHQFCLEHATKNKGEMR